MSPGPTFERVYLELKRQLREGTRPLGTPLEPTAIGDELGTSFTPVRDALHRLVGEGLVETPRHNGFAVPNPTEQALRDLYAWNSEVLTIIVAHRYLGTQSAGDLNGSTVTTPSAEALFLGLAEQSGNREHVRIVTLLNDRLAPFRQAESRVLLGTAEEMRALSEDAFTAKNITLSRSLVRYHRRRIGAVAQLLGEMQEVR